LGTERVEGGRDDERGGTTPFARKRKSEGAIDASTLGLDAGSAQQSAMIRGGVGAQLRHLTVRRVDVHVHLLSARVGIDMKTYWRRNGENFQQERNERASPFTVREPISPGS
jgi:hypothetical protein